ncbi:MAG TPA: hypothetical protein VGM50_16245 [Gemmatimonadaceae bacterium]|jgi:hypothetical protein
MFWEGNEWALVPADQMDFVRLIVHRGLGDRPERHHFVTADGDGIAWRIHSIRVRQLRFYPNHWLYEFGIDTPTDSQFGRAQQVRAYAIAGRNASNASASNGTETKSVAKPPHQRDRSSSGEWTTTLIDWKSPTIHGLNEQVQIELRSKNPDGSLASLDTDLANDYLDFFTSFIAGDSGSPFIILHGGTCAEPGHVTTYTAIPLEARIKERYLPGSEDIAAYLGERFPTDNTSDPTDLDDLDERRKLEEPPTSKDATESSSPDVAPKTADHKAIASEAEAASHSKEEGDDADAKPASADPEPPVNERITSPQLKLTAEGAAAATFVLYEDVVFKANFTVEQSKPGAVQVAMESDSPVQRTGNAIAPILVIPIAPFSVVLLTESNPRSTISAKDFIDRLEHHQHNALSRKLISNLCVIGNVELRAARFKRPIAVEDCEFLYPVVLDDVDADAGVEFKNCTFASLFSARNATIRGDLVIQRSSFYGFGLPVESDAAVDLDGLQLEGNLEAARVRVYGMFNARHAKIDGRLSCNGIDQRARKVRAEPDGQAERTGLSLHGARVSQGVDISCASDKVVDVDIFRSRLESAIDATALHTSSFAMRGAIVRSLDLSYAQIDGLADLSPGVVSRARETTLLRTRVLADISMRCAKVGELRIQCLFVGEDFDTISARIASGLWGQTGWHYRLWVKGEILLDGIHTPYINLRGARVEKTLVVTTGHIGSLELGVSVFDRQDTPERDWFPTELGALSVTRVSGLRRIDVGGARIGGALDSSIRFEHIDVNGDIMLRVDKERVEREVVKHLGGRIPWAAAAKAGRTQTQVAGAVVFRKVRTRGFIDLTNTRVGVARKSVTDVDVPNANLQAAQLASATRGHVLLNDVRIGTDLFARSSQLRGEEFKTGTSASEFNLELRCAKLELDNARISGDAILSGLNLRSESETGGRLTARNLRVGGHLEFVTENSKVFARLGSSVILTGLRAAELRLTKDSLPDVAEPVVRLDRAKLGRLAVHQPIPALNLSDTEIRTWHLRTRDSELGEPGPRPPHELRKAIAAARRRQGKNVIDILTAMKPFDRMVWMRYETELRNSAAKELADVVYRSMRLAEARSRNENTQQPRVRQWLRQGRDLIGRRVFGYGTRVSLPLLLWGLIGVIVFVTVSDPRNVVASDGLLTQLATQCRSLDPASTRTLPAKCVAYANAARATQDPGLQLTAEAVDSKLGIAESLRLTARYAVPVLGAIGDPDWVPAGGDHDARILRNDTWHFPFAPATITFVAWISCTVLATLVVSFYRDRWFKR